ncbi:MAG: YggS family pyridoxal phosphate-dependent enzyme [Rhodospirillaceae bacterium]|nr:YggS family pyridoxal phosphate-dependent enzyme [Rhodospirillaceae bacterium]OUU59335.1 MAG: YggS family pyridoxal phosphate enzyme [Candidatus Endolissoclinum sp. TMED55]
MSINEPDSRLNVAKNLDLINQKIEASLKGANRPRDDVQLIAVSKVQPVEKIEAALVEGHRLFGENRVQEAALKWPALKTKYPNAKLHLIGPLQTNKVKDAIMLFDVIETLDRLKLAEEIKKQSVKKGSDITCYVQVNTGEEQQKAGVFPAEAEEFVRYCQKTVGLNIKGLMCIPPINEEPALHFSLLAAIAGRLNLPTLSMGMSDDFETAIAFGATHVRIGSSIFGERASI